MEGLGTARTLLVYLEALIAMRRTPEEERDARAMESISHMSEDALGNPDAWMAVFRGARTATLRALRDRVCLAGLRALDLRMSGPRPEGQEERTTGTEHRPARRKGAAAAGPAVERRGIDEGNGPDNRRCRETGTRKFALVAMPWFWAHMPSIQLAIVKDVLRTSGIESDVFEFYVDFIDMTGPHLYREVANTGTYIGERLFSQFYFDALRYDTTQEIPDMHFFSGEIQRDFLLFGTPLVERFLDGCLKELCSFDYDAICFTLTAQQTGATIALARRIRERRRDVPIIIGGAACAGDMGRALLEMCPELDIAVHSEAETVLPRLSEALAGQRPLADVAGISWREEGAVLSAPATGLHRLSRHRDALNFDAYFARVDRTAVLADSVVWIPFESSRGCWYGEKVQCTFCGLNEIIRYRKRGAGGLLEELQDYACRYGVRNFFAVDLIMPRSFFTEELPAIAAAGKEWSIFYEVKSNMRRQEIALLSRSGVRWIQPGIESLDDDVLKLMRKGVSAAQNVQTLRLSKQQGIMVSWNLISNFPDESAESYENMARMFPRLYHLDPPSGMSPFEVHRFSPFYETPEKLGIRVLGAHESYRDVFPVDEALLDRLVYRFRYEAVRPPDRRLADSRKKVGRAIANWKEAWRRGADFHVTYRPDGTAHLMDSRRSGARIERVLDPPQAKLLHYLEELRARVRLAAAFADHEPAAFAALGGEEGLRHLIADWERQGLVLVISGTVQALPRIVPPTARRSVAA